MYSKRAFVHWYVGEGMEEVCNALYQLIWLDPCSSRVSSLKLVRILPHWRKTTKKLVRILLNQKKRKENIKAPRNAFKYSEVYRYPLFVQTQNPLPLSFPFMFPCSVSRSVYCVI